MDKLQQQLCIGITSSSICAYVALKAYESIQQNNIKLGYYVLFGLTLTGVFAGAFQTGWHMGFAQLQNKIKELQQKYAELEDICKQLQQKTAMIQTNSDTDDSEDYETIKRLKFV